MTKKSHRDTLEQMIEAKKRAGDGPKGSAPPIRPKDNPGLVKMSEKGLAEQLTHSIAWPDFGLTGEMDREWRVVAGLAQARIVKLVAKALVDHGLFYLGLDGRIEFLFGDELIMSEDFQQMVRQSLSGVSPEQMRKWVQRLRKAADKLEEDLGDAEAEVLDS